MAGVEGCCKLEQKKGMIYLSSSGLAWIKSGNSTVLTIVGGIGVD